MTAVNQHKWRSDVPVLRNLAPVVIPGSDVRRRDQLILSDFEIGSVALLAEKHLSATMTVKVHDLELWTVEGFMDLRERVFLDDGPCHEFLLNLFQVRFR